METATTMLKHTPGEWTYTNANRSDYFDIDSNGNRIASIFINPEFPEQSHEQEANARLIAAAPELLRSLKAMTNLAEHGVEHAVKNSHPEERDGHRDGLFALIEEAKAAIKKATT